MLTILDGPMAPHHFGKALKMGERAYIVAAFGRGLVTDDAVGLDSAHRRQTCPVGLLRQPVQVATEVVAAGFEASVVLLHGLPDRWEKGSGKSRGKRGQTPFLGSEWPGEPTLLYYKIGSGSEVVDFLEPR